MKPILFNTEMVKAILDGRKTVTRRVLAENEMFSENWGLDREPYKYNDKWCYDKQTEVDASKTYEIKLRYKVGDILYVRETFGKDKNGKYHYRADYPEHDCEPYPIWHPSIHMPKEAARIFLKVTNVRVERLQDMTQDDCLKEGCSELSEEQFSQFWNSTFPKYQLCRYGWEANPWVWVIELEKVEVEDE